ncbi:MAG: hypothetical protein ABJN69_05045 [Hellea sp.]
MAKPKILARKVARELTFEELDLVSGGNDGSVTGTGCSSINVGWPVYSCSDASDGGLTIPEIEVQEAPPDEDMDGGNDPLDPPMGG